MSAPDFSRSEAIADIANYLQQATHIFGRYQDRFGGDAPADPMADVVGPAAVAVRMFCAKADVNSALRMLREAATFDHPPADGFVHLYCADCGSFLAPCGYYGPDEPPGADQLPQCPVCLEMQNLPCPQCGEADSEATFDHPPAAGEAGARLQPPVSTNTGGGSPGGDAHAPGAGDSAPRVTGRASVPHMTFTAAPCTCPICRPRVSG